MARTYQSGCVKARKKKKRTVWVLRYRQREGTRWIEKTEELEGCKNLTEARHSAQKRMVEINDFNRGPGLQRLTFAAFIEGKTWRNYLARLKPSTIYSYESLIKTYLLPAFGEKLLGDIMPEDVTLFFEARQKHMTSGYLLKLYGLLKVIFAVAIEYDLVENSPVRTKLHRPTLDREPKPILSSEEIRAVLLAVAEQHRVLVCCAAITGLRLGELLGLQWQNLDLVNAKLNITHSLWRGELVSPKTKATKRSIHLPAPMVELLELRRAGSFHTSPNDFVFCKADGSPLDPDLLRREVLYPALQKAGIERRPRAYGFHIFRHSAASIVHARTRDLALTQELLAHSSVSTTADIYTHTKTAAEAATELLAREIISTCGLIVAQNEGKPN